MRIDFAVTKWNPNDFEYVDSLRTPCGATFMQETDCIVNDTQKENINDHNYVSLLHGRVMTLPAEVETECLFERFGAPLIVLTDDVRVAEDGRKVYGHHFEVVAYEEGINVWELNGTEQPLKIAYARFPVTAGEKLTLRVRLNPGRITAELNGQVLEAKAERLPMNLRAGITGCEGVNRFYRFTVSEH